jgi:cell wall-associated NlpC family hydrolase
MEKQDINKFIGIPHQFGGDSYESCDCLGLCRLFYREHNVGLDFTDGKPITKDWKKDGHLRLRRYFKKYFVRVEKDELQYGDIVLFDLYGDTHFGVYTDYGNVLSMFVPVEYGVTKSTIYKRHVWERAFRRGYRPWKH